MAGTVAWAYSIGARPGDWLVPGGPPQTLSKAVTDALGLGDVWPLGPVSPTATRLWKSPQDVDSQVAANPTLSVLAVQPHAKWVGDWVSTSQVADVVADYAAQAAGRTMVLCSYAIPGRDLGSYSAGGFPDRASYLAWVGSFGSGTGGAPTLHVFEPDALGHLPQMTSAVRAERTETMRQALAVHSAVPGMETYVDVGMWNSVAVSADLLVAVGVAAVAGFAINVSNFVSQESCYAYGDALVAELAGRGITGKRYVIDSSRNGNGPLTAAFGAAAQPWFDTNQTQFNPPGRAPGLTPGVVPNRPLCRATLWIKNPGGSDGTFPTTTQSTYFGSSAPAAGTFWPGYARDLVASTRTLTATLRDPFTDAALPLWPGTFGGVTVNAGRARLPVVAAGYAGLVSGRTMQLLSSSVSAALYPPAKSTASSAYVDMAVMATPDSTRLITRVDAATGLITFASEVGYYDPATVALTYDSTAHRFVRIREAAGTVYWETSPDGTAWTVRRSSPTPDWVGDTPTLLQFSTNRDAGVTDFAEVGSLNVAAVQFPTDIADLGWRMENTTLGAVGSSAASWTDTAAIVPAWTQTTAASQPTVVAGPLAGSKALYFGGAQTLVGSGKAALLSTNVAGVTLTVVATLDTITPGATGEMVHVNRGPSSSTSNAGRTVIQTMSAGTNGDGTTRVDGSFGASIRRLDTDAVYNVGAAPVPVNTWFVATLVVDYAGGTVTTYQNGEKTSVSTLPSAGLTQDTTSAQVSIGGNARGATNYHLGKLAASYAWKHALTDAEVARVHTYVQDTTGIQVVDYQVVPSPRPVITALTAPTNVNSGGFAVSFATDRDCYGYGEVSTDGGATWVVKSQQTGYRASHSKTFAGLTPSTAYRWRVRAVDRAGQVRTMFGGMLFTPVAQAATTTIILDRSMYPDGWMSWESKVWTPSMGYKFPTLLGTDKFRIFCPQPFIDMKHQLEIDGGSWVMFGLQSENTDCWFTPKTGPGHTTLDVSPTGINNNTFLRVQGNATNAASVGNLQFRALEGAYAKGLYFWEGIDYNGLADRDDTFVRQNFRADQINWCNVVGKSGHEGGDVDQPIRGAQRQIYRGVTAVTTYQGLFLQGGGPAGTSDYSVLESLEMKRVQLSAHPEDGYSSLLWDTSDSQAQMTHDIGTGADGVYLDPLTFSPKNALIRPTTNNTGGWKDKIVIGAAPREFVPADQVGLAYPFIPSQGVASS